MGIVLPRILNIDTLLFFLVKSVVFIYIFSFVNRWQDTHSRFRRSVNYGAPSMENSFQVAKFLFEVQKTASLFCLVQNGPGVIWVACLGLRECSKWSLRCARAFLEVFWTFSNTWDTQSQQAARMQFPKKYGIWIIMPPPFHDLHILTDSLEQAKLDLIHCCQLH